MNLVKKTIIALKNKSFVISYSGGLDSTVLLHQLIEIRKKIPQIKIRAIHINHNINISSKKWVKHCEKTCQNYQVPLIVKNININRKIHQKNIEEKLRIKRYTIIYQNLKTQETLLTGHHMNDQCETFFLSLKRGSGPTGLSSMSFKTLLGNKEIVRPFLEKTKKELKLWAKNNNLNWIEDFSNYDIYYDRNYIRYKVIPVLEEKWPFFLKNCLRTIKICREETNLLNDFLFEKMHNLIQFDYSLNINNFKNIKKEMCTAIIRRWIALQTKKNPSYKNIESIYYQTVYSKKDANPKIILQKNEIRRYKKSLYFIKRTPFLKNTILFWHDTNMKLNLPDNLGYLIKNEYGSILPSPKNDELINIRFQQEGTVLILGRNKKRKIKKIWQEKNIPPWLRNQIPLLFYNDIFISALGVFSINMKNQNIKYWRVSWIHLLRSKNNLFQFY